MDATASTRRDAAVRWSLYLALAAVMLTEQFGRATNDTRLELVERPGRFLQDALTLWDPQVSLGQLQNQAYGYLFPQGPFFLLGDLAGVPGWLIERGWSLLLVIAACEGARRVTRVVGVMPAAATLAGFAYALTPRLVAEVGVRSAEILPAVVLPWALLPVLHLLQGRQRPWVAAVLSAAAFACGGGVNGTATAAPAGLLAVVVGWAWWQRRVDWRFVAGWFALIATVSVWWLLSLVRLGAYSPPFYDYVEDARTTTGTAGASAALRGASNWVDYLTSGGFRWWPAGYEVSFAPWVVGTTALVAAAGVVGLARHRGVWRTPLLLGLLLGFALVTIAHVGTATSPLAPGLRDLLDGVLAPLRNVPKADPIMRLPLAIGVGLLAQEALEVLASDRLRPGLRPGLRLGRDAVRPLVAGGVVAALVVGLLGAAWPVLTGSTRTPGWTALPDSWQQASAYLDEGTRDGDDGAVWVVPGSGFAIQTWGWSMEEPLQVLGDTPWLTRSQVPLTPPATIRLLSSLETYLETGSGSPALAATLRRIGVDRVLLRHDLDQAPAQGIDPGLVSRALARSPGITRTATFGQAEVGPAIEIFEVRGGSDGVRARPLATARTIASSIEDVVAAIGAGLLGDDEAALVPGGPGVRAASADVLGDGYRRRERNFGRVHDAESGVRTADEPSRSRRVVTDYPGPSGAEPVTALYDGVSSIDATSSAGWADILGPIRPETAPWSVIDGDTGSYWLSAPFADAVGQGVSMDFPAPRSVGGVELQQPVAVVGLQLVRRWQVRLEVPDGRDVVRTADADPVTGELRITLPELVRASGLRVTAVGVDDPADQIGISEIALTPRLAAARTLTVPAPRGGLAPGASLVFGAAPETRACDPTLLGPDCDPARARPAEESTGIDRTVALDAPATYRVRADVIARSRPATAALLQSEDGVRVTASSWLGDDPGVSPRMALDADPATSWIADPRDPAPTLSLDLGRRRTIDAVAVAPPSGTASRPTQVIVTGGGQRRTVDLTGLGLGGDEAQPSMVAFRPLTARRVTLAFSREDDSGFPLGVASVRLRGASVASPLDGAAPTGAGCGFGPALVVDGVEHPTSVIGPIGAVLGDATLQVRVCDGPLELSTGTHRIGLRATEQFQPTSLVLDGAEPGARVAANGDADRTDRAVQVTDRSRTSIDLQVAAGDAALLSLPQSFNVGWQAVLVAADGSRTDLVPVQADGWAQGFDLPAGGAGRIELRFAPQRGYAIGLYGGLGLLGLVMVLALALLVVRRPTAEIAAERLDPDRPRAGRRGRAVATGAAVVAGLVVSGPFAAVAAALGAVAARAGGVALRRGAGLLGGLLLLAGVVAVVVDIVREPQYPGDIADQCTACGVWLLAVLALLRAPERGGRSA